MQGRWSKLYQSFFTSDIMADHAAALLFQCLWSFAAHERRLTKWGYTVERGECDLSIDQMAGMLRCDRKTIIRRLKILNAAGRITQARRATQHAPAVWRVANYERYQPEVNPRPPQKGRLEGRLTPRLKGHSKESPKKDSQSAAPPPPLTRAADAAGGEWKGDSGYGQHADA